MFFRRKNRIKVEVLYNGIDSYKARATDGERYVWNCYGSTKESAKEMALYQLKKFQEEQLSNNWLRDLHNKQ